MTYSVIIPFKQTSRGKSRLRLPDGQRSVMAMAMVRDTLAAVTAVGLVHTVLVVAEDAEDAAAVAGGRVEVLVTQVLGLNEAIAVGARELAARGWLGPIAVLPGDLPFLTAADLTRALTEAAGGAAVVADAAGTGTTMLVAASPAELTPRFGPDSYRLHRDIGARAIPVARGSTLHMDVDVVADLHLPGELGQLGAYTRAVLTGPNGSAQDEAVLASRRESLQVTVLP